MKTNEESRHALHEGDACKVRSDTTYEEHLIDYEPQHLIEDLDAEEPMAAAAAPVESGNSSNWWAWAVAGLIGLFIIAGAFFYFNRDNGRFRREATASVSSATAPLRAGIASAVSGNVENYAYFFDNDKSAVPDNRTLDNLAKKVEQDGADVVVTAYASTTGNEDYNMRLSAKRANNIAKYLISHGVPSSHVRVVPSGESTTYGDNAHNRRANIHVTYHG